MLCAEKNVDSDWKKAELFWEKKKEKIIYLLEDFVAKLNL